MKHSLRMQLQRRILFPNAFAVDDLRKNKYKGILADFPLYLTTKAHKKGKNLHLKYFKLKFRNNFSPDKGA